MSKRKTCTHRLPRPLLGTARSRYREREPLGSLAHAQRCTHLTKDMPPRLLRFQSAAPMALPTRMAADTAATRAMAHRGKVLGTVNGASDESLPDDEAELPYAPSSGAVAAAGPAAGPLRGGAAHC